MRRNRCNTTPFQTKDHDETIMMTRTMTTNRRGRACRTCTMSEEGPDVSSFLKGLCVLYKEELEEREVSLFLKGLCVEYKEELNPDAYAYCARQDERGPMSLAETPNTHHDGRFASLRPPPPPPGGGENRKQTEGGRGREKRKKTRRKNT